ncbi:unnamed protein product, partial [Ilex paraguariensis]
VPLHAQLALQPGHARRQLALVHAACRAGELGLYVGNAAHQAHARGHVAEEAPFHAPVALLAAEGEDVGDGIGVAVGPLDLIEAEGVGEVAQVQLQAQLLLPGLVGREHFARVGRRHGCGGALAQAFDVVGVDRDTLAGLHQQRGGRRGGAFVIARGARARGHVEGVAEHLLAAQAQGELHAVLRKRQGVGHADAGQPQFGARDRGRVEAGGRAPDGVVDVGDPVLGQHVAAAELLVGMRVVGGVERPLVAHAGRVELALEAGLGRLLVHLEAQVCRVGAVVAGRVEDLDQVGPRGTVPGLAGAHGGIGRDAVAQVEFAAHHGALVLGVVEGPAGVEQGVGLGRPGHGQACGQVDAAVQAVGAVLAAVQVGRQAGTVAAPVQAQRGQPGLFFLVVHGAVAVTQHAVEADAELLALAEPPAQVDVGAQLRIRHEGGGQPRQRLVARALGHEVDRAAHRATGRHAVEQGRGALEHVHALEHFWRCAVERRHAEQPAKRDIADAGAEAANGVVLADDAGHARAEHGGVG